MDWLRLLGLALLTAGLTMILRQLYPPVASALGVVFGAMMLCALLPVIREYVAAVALFLDGMSLGGQYAETMLKAMGIVLLTQLSSEACQELGAPGIARYAEFCGRIALLGVAVPVFISLTEMAVDVLK
ncbi:MAG: hypothetical protein IKU34_08975 [Clostridia bacterium]|nr:hypothetical protein [Clostridia bacterium]